MDTSIFIFEEESVKDALKKLDKAREKVLLVVDRQTKLLGTITDGDLRRYILKGRSIENDIGDVYNKHPVVMHKKGFSLTAAKDILLKNSVKLIPILDDGGSVVDFVSRSQMMLSGEFQRDRLGSIDVPVVIMAGGKSTRLEPFSKIFPKPLFPIGDKPIVEIIIDEFKKHGGRKFYLTLNYKGDMIQSFFNNKERDYDLEYVWENDFFGTAGSLKLLENKIEETFIVSNCDVIVRANFEEVVRSHKEQAAALTVLSSFQHYKIPYGVINFKTGGEVVDITEKPEYTFTVNTGTYILDKRVLAHIPENTRLDMTELIGLLMRDGEKVITYPVNENDYIDIGQWDDYKKALEKIYG